MIEVDRNDNRFYVGKIYPQINFAACFKYVVDRRSKMRSNRHLGDLHKQFNLGYAHGWFI